MQELITRAKELLADGTVARVLGWKAGDLPYNPEAAFAKNFNNKATNQKSCLPLKSYQYPKISLYLSLLPASVWKYQQFLCCLLHLLLL